MRLFLAIDLPDNIKEKIDKQLFHLKKQYPDFAWVPKENFHITLFFYGETDKLEKIKKKIKDLIYDSSPFYLYTRNVGLFFNEKIVIYLGFEREKKLEKLASKINYYFTPIYKKYTNPQKIKNFIPHLTLARYKIPSKQQYLHLKKKLEKIDIRVSFIVKKITLYQSLLGGKKPIYKKLATFSLLDK